MTAGAASETIICRACKSAKPVSEFAPAKFKQPHERNGKTRCRPCIIQYHRDYGKRPEVRQYRLDYAKSPENRKRLTALQREANKRHGPLRAKLYMIKHKYGLSASEYAAMLARQGGHCASCGGDPDGRGLAVDHDHATGAVRELLCHPCNQGIGHFRDDPERMRLAAAYIERHE